MFVEPLCEVRAVPGKGRGVFLRVPVPAGTVLETAPVLELSGADIERIAGTVVDDYHFAHPADPDGGCLVFGHASLLNHSARPNVELRWERRGEAGWFVSIVTLADLPAGTELLYRYRCPPWFAVIE